MLTNYGVSVYEIQPVDNKQYRQRDVDDPLSSHTRPSLALGRFEIKWALILQMRYSFIRINITQSNE